MQETWVRSLYKKDSLEKEMATHSGGFAWKIPCTEEPSGLQSLESRRCTKTKTEIILFISLFLSITFQYS